MIRYQAAGL